MRVRDIKLLQKVLKKDCLNIISHSIYARKDMFKDQNNH